MNGSKADITTAPRECPLSGYSEPLNDQGLCPLSANNGRSSTAKHRAIAPEAVTRHCNGGRPPVMRLSYVLCAPFGSVLFRQLKLTDRCHHGSCNTSRTDYSLSRYLLIPSRCSEGGKRTDCSGRQHQRSSMRINVASAVYPPRGRCSILPQQFARETGDLPAVVREKLRNHA